MGPVWYRSAVKVPAVPAGKKVYLWLGSTDGRVKVFVNVRGQGKELTIKPTSEPPLPETEIYTLLATGRRTLKAGSGASMNQGQVASVLGSVLGTGLPTVKLSGSQNRST